MLKISAPLPHSTSMDRQPLSLKYSCFLPLGTEYSLGSNTATWRQSRDVLLIEEFHKAGERWHLPIPSNELLSIGFICKRHSYGTVRSEHRPYVTHPQAVIEHAVVGMLLEFKMLTYRFVVNILQNCMRRRFYMLKPSHCFSPHSGYGIV